MHYIDFHDKTINALHLTMGGGGGGGGGEEEVGIKVMGTRAYPKAAAED